MRDLRNTILETATKQLAGTLPYAWLFEVRIPSDPPQRIRLTSYMQPITRGTDSDGNPLVYLPYPIAIGDMTDQVHANLSDVTINVANVTREFMDEVDKYEGLAGEPIVIRFINTAGASDPNAEVRYDARVVRCHVTDSVATFSVSATNLAKSLFPKNRFMARDCIWRFGGTDCGYVIPDSPGETVGTGFSFCGRELEDCEERGADEAARGLLSQHPLRFGGCPGMKGGVP